MRIAHTVGQSKNASGIVVRVIPPVILLLFLTSSITPAFSQFEGIIESDNITTDETGALVRFVMSIWVKNDMARIQTVYEGDVPGTTMIYRNDRRVVWMLNDDDRTYFEIFHDEQTPPVGRIPDSDADEALVVKKTGKTKKILGYLCEQIFLLRGDQKTEIWGTKQLGHVSAAMARALGEDTTNIPDEREMEVRRMGMFPLFSSTRIEGNVVESQEVKRIEPVLIPLEMFQLPEGYKRQSVSSEMEEERK